MEDEEDSESLTPPALQNDPSKSPIESVTVASFSPLAHRSLTLALPAQKPRPTTTTTTPTPTPTTTIKSVSHGREDCWSEGATSSLIDAWGERFVELNRGNLKQKHWIEVADVVASREDYSKQSKTHIQCKNRIDTLKKKYKIEKAKIDCGVPTNWAFFDRLDQLIGAFSNKNEDHHKIPVARAVRSVRNRPGKEPESGNSADSTESFPPEKRILIGKRRRMERDPDRIRMGGNWESMRKLNRAILKFGEMYEMMEKSKLKQMRDLELQRMKLMKDLELQRIQSFMKTQIELCQITNGRRVGGNGRHYSDSSS